MLVHDTVSSPGPAAVDWLRPAALDDALSALATGRWQVIAGGTDVYPARIGRPLQAPLLDITGIQALKGLASGLMPDGRPAWRIGAATTWSDLVRGDLPAELDALVMAAREVGGVQIQNQGTLGGNLCNASPAADGVPALLALDASVELASAGGGRMLPLAEFVRGPRRTARRTDELLVAVWVPQGSPQARSAFAKLGHRRYLVISITMAAVSVDFDTRDRVSRCGIAVGSAGPVACRLPAVESALRGLSRASLAQHARQALAAPQALAPLSPIDDVRGSAAYRLQAAAELAARLVADLAASR